MTGPDGKAIPVNTLTDMGNNIWRIGFAEQSASGQYYLVIGPHIEDLLGMGLDQDKDRICGEAEDIYKAGFQLSTGAEQSVLMINVHGGYYDADGQHIFDTLVNAGVNATFVDLYDSTESNLTSLLQDISNQFNQVWVFDLSAGIDNYPAAWQAIADWFNADPTRAIICDGRMISSYWSGRWADEGQKLTENYYENMKLKGGGLLLGTDHDAYQSGINSINDLIGLDRFSGSFSLSRIPVDINSMLMTFPHNMGVDLSDDSSPGQTPYGLQPNGRILYSVAWHGGNHNTPGISSTTEGTAGFHVRIQVPATGSHFYVKQPVTLQAISTNATQPVTYTWSSSIDGELGTGEVLEISTLSVGEHVITLTGEDSGSGADTDTITVIIDDLPDLMVSQISWNPANPANPPSDIEAGEEVTFTATVQNSGAVAVVNSFTVDFQIDGESIGSQSINQTIPSGNSIQVSKIWTAVVGNHTISVVADSSGHVLETEEGNNTLTQNLPEILDKTPPTLVKTAPQNGAFVQSVDKIEITLFDRDGQVDDAYVIGSVTVKDGSDQVVSGTISESDDQFTFIPDSGSLSDGLYRVSFTAKDMAGNSRDYQFSFTIDTTPPSITITSPADGCNRQQDYSLLSPDF